MRPSVLKAVCELRFARAQALEVVLRTLTADYPVQHRLPDTLAYELQSRDGAWLTLISPHHAAVTAPEGSPVEDYTSRFRRFADLLQEALQGELIRSVRVQFADALPLLVTTNYDDLLNKALREGPWEHQGEFAQTLTGTSRGYEYALRFGVHHFQGEPCYLAEASLVALNVQTEALSDLIERLGEEAAQLLAWPLAEEAAYQALLSDSRLSGFFPHILEIWPPASLLLTDPAPSEINQERVSLITRKHLGEAWTAQDESRLENLTTKVRDLWPKVTSADWYRLGKIENRIEERAERLRTLERELALKLAS